VTLTNVPRIRDIETLAELIRSLGVSIEWVERNTLHIHAKEIRPEGSTASWRGRSAAPSCWQARCSAARVASPSRRRVAT
jgi:UDP-N-acetylglucosamine enolpyruvyl transferase